MSAARQLSVVLVDPSRFTVPYDAQLSEGLMRADVKPVWSLRPLRAGESEELPPEAARHIFYRRSDRLGGMLRPVRGPLKALAHLVGLWRLSRLAREMRADIIHFQWTVLPLFDAAAIWLLRRRYRLLLTVHDSIPFNGQRMPFFQRFLYDLPIKLVDKVIVHTDGARRALSRRGIEDARITVIPHGPLRLRVAASPMHIRDPRWTFVMFGKIKHYKGLDVLVEAIGQAADRLRGRARFVVAGATYMEMDALGARIGALGIADLIDLRIGYLSDSDLAGIFHEADAFLFPYRQIDASGAYYMAKTQGKWIIASKVGVFAEVLEDGRDGALVPPEDAAALSRALVEAAELRSIPRAGGRDASWEVIGLSTAALYEQLVREGRA
jgi:glycosyltransferase involved in cell wall biosynthesis